MKKKNAGYSAVISIALTALISGFLLSFVYSQFAEDIRLNKERVITEGVKTVLPSAITIEGPKTDNGALPYYVGYDDSTNITGYALLSKGTGYNGTVTVLVGFDSALTHITGITPTEQAETPGLGAKITEDDFKKQFNNKTLEENIVVVKGISPEGARKYEIAAITGATISANAVVEAVNLAKEEVLNLPNEKATTLPNTE